MVNNRAKFHSSLQIAAGCFGVDGYGEAIGEAAYSSLSAIVLKTTTLQPLIPARDPQFVQFKTGNYWNYVGLRNPGIGAVDQLLRSRSLHLLPNLWLSLHAQASHEYLGLIERANQIPYLVGYEINLSCPNLAVAKAPPLPDFEELARATSKPLRYKLSAKDALSFMNQVDLRFVEAIVIGNTLPYKGGGLSGPILKDRHQKLITQLRLQYPKLEIIGVGGVQSSVDVLEYLKAGANKVQIGAHFKASGKPPLF